MRKDCLFCNMPEERVVAEIGEVYAIWDGFPVTKSHALIIPKFHIESPLDWFLILNEQDHYDIWTLVYKMQFMALKDDLVTGFNIGMNDGVSAGQTIMHAHLHIIPRRDGDVENPKGGIRNIIPNKGDYTVDL